jgi:hypothetical protein
MLIQQLAALMIRKTSSMHSGPSYSDHCLTMYQSMCGKKSKKDIGMLRRCMAEFFWVGEYDYAYATISHTNDQKNAPYTFCPFIFWSSLDNISINRWSKI